MFLARLKISLTPSFITAFFLLPALILVLGLIFNRNEGLALRAGLLVSAADNNPVSGQSAASRIMKGVAYYAQDCEIVPYTDEEKMKQDVAAHRLECAYVLTEKVEKNSPYGQDGKGAIITYRSPMTVMNKVLDLIVAAAYLETMAGELGAEVLTPFLAELENGETVAGGTDLPANANRGSRPGAETGTGLADELQARADEYLKDGALMEMILLESGEQEAADTKPAPYRRLFHGLTGLFGWLLSLLCAMGLTGTAEPSVISRLKSTGRRMMGYTLAGFGVVFLSAWLFLTVTVRAGAFFYPGLGVGWLVESTMGLSYALALAGTSVLLAAFTGANRFPALISFVFIFASLMGGVFFDIREILSSAGFIRYFFLNYYYTDGISRAVGEGLAALIKPAALLSGVGLAAGLLAARLASGRKG